MTGVAIARRRIHRRRPRLGERQAAYARKIAQVDVAERERDLQRQRAQRQRARCSPIGSKPAHDLSHPAVGRNV